MYARGRERENCASGRRGDKAGGGGGVADVNGMKLLQ